jgi:hypothetical protein
VPRTRHRKRRLGEGGRVAGTFSARSSRRPAGRPAELWRRSYAWCFRLLRDRSRVGRGGHAGGAVRHGGSRLRRRVSRGRRMRRALCRPVRAALCAALRGSVPGALSAAVLPAGRLSALYVPGLRHVVPPVPGQLVLLERFALPAERAHEPRLRPPRLPRSLLEPLVSDRPGPGVGSRPRQDLFLGALTASRNANRVPHERPTRPLSGSLETHSRPPSRRGIEGATGKRK